jgi:hypothetical protein
VKPRVHYQRISQGILNKKKLLEQEKKQQELTDSLVLEGKFIKPIEIRPTKKELIEISRSAVLLRPQSILKELPPLEHKRTETSQKGSSAKNIEDLANIPQFKSEMTSHRPPKDSNQGEIFKPSPSYLLSGDKSNDIIKSNKSESPPGKKPSRVRLPPIDMQLPDPVKPTITKNHKEPSKTQKNTRKQEIAPKKGILSFEEAVIVPKVVKYSENAERFGTKKTNFDQDLEKFLEKGKNKKLDKK